jgi:hypothetical protein
VCSRAQQQLSVPCATARVQHVGADAGSR